MNIAFTICSNNYLAHAKTLGDSFVKHHPNIKFVIGLVDKLNSDFDYDSYLNFEIIPIEKIAIHQFDELLDKYNITELNTAVKPSFFHYIFQEFSAKKVIYIDPDIMVTSSFDEVINLLDTKNIILTPHLCKPIDDEFAPTDYHTLKGGVFNLGFIALSVYNEIKSFLDWWNDRVMKYGFSDVTKGMFYDQIWINYVPTLYDNYHILKHPGYNMANWNLHERTLSIKNLEYYVNEEFPLRFFHFSSYKFTSPEQICTYLTRFNFHDRPDLVLIFDQYQKKLIENNVEKISNMKVYFFPDLNKSSRISLMKRILNRMVKTWKTLIYG